MTKCGDVLRAAWAAWGAMWVLVIDWTFAVDPRENHGNPWASGTVAGPSWCYWLPGSDTDSACCIVAVLCYIEWFVLYCGWATGSFIERKKWRLEKWNVKPTKQRVAFPFITLWISGMEIFSLVLRFRPLFLPIRVVLICKWGPAAMVEW